MARLVAVCRSEDYPFERRQIPLIVDDNLTMAIQFSDTCVCCDQAGIKAAELERFVKRFGALTADEVTCALTVSSKEVFGLLSQLVPCVGCRRSVERLFKQLVESGYPALEPLVISRSSVLSIKRDYLFEPKAMFALFYVHGSKLNNVIESIPKSKKNKRCVLHSLDTHKAKSLGSWMDIWDLLSQDCREEVVLVDSEDLIDTLDNYLRKHRFCSECKSKVLRAYSILMGDLDSGSEKGYCAALYDGVRCCRGERHLHILCETDFIAHLIGRAEPELTGSRRERHAKTLDIAQEEVLTCLGVYLYERLHRIWQKLRAEEQTWQILFCLGVDALRKNFELALEKKQGISNLELMCQELLEEEEAQEQKRAQKRLKRKKKKNKNKDEEAQNADPDKENCMCPDMSGSNSPAAPVAGRCQRPATAAPSACKCAGAAPPVAGGGGAATRTRRGGGSSDSGTSNRSDPGYSSGHEWYESCSGGSAAGSRDGSDVACSDGICNHDSDCTSHIANEMSATCHGCRNSGCGNHQTRAIADCTKCGGAQILGKASTSHSGRNSMKLTSLQDMLEASCGSGTEADDFISEEEILQFRQANQQSLRSQREQLRATLRQRFANMRRRCQCDAAPSLPP